MLGRFARRSTQKILADWFGVELEDMPWLASSFDVAPQSVQPVVRLSRDASNPEFALIMLAFAPFMCAVGENLVQEFPTTK
jgi:hypothetical protein